MNWLSDEARASVLASWCYFLTETTQNWDRADPRDSKEGLAGGEEI